MRLLPLLLLCACPGLPTDSDDVVDPEPDTGDAPPLTDLPTGVCGALEYDWVPLSDVGTVVSWERASELDLSAQAIRGLLAAGGFPSDRLDIQYDVEVYRMRYRTQDRGQVVETTALVSLPDVDGPVPTLAWLHGTTGFADQCAPSGAGLEGAAGNLLLSSLGVMVVAPDYLGMNGFGPPSDQVHPYTIAEPTAVASLDGIRAAWRLFDDIAPDAEPTRQTVLFGGSEGGFAALWSERYAPWYLPSAEIAGVVASVPPTDILGLAEVGAVDLQATSLALGAAMTTYREWYGWDEPLTEVLTDTEPNNLASSLPDLLNSSCNVDGGLEIPESTADVFAQPFLQAVEDDALADYGPWGCALEANSLVTPPFERISTTPVMYVFSGADDLVDHRTNRADIPRLCEQGYDMTVIECEGAGHTEGAVSSIHLQWRWVQDRLAGEPMTDVCGLPEPIDCLNAE